MWSELPPELRVNILTRLELPPLRALKRLGREMANDCRRVIRSEAWQDLDYKNEMLLTAEVSNSVQNLTFPLTVSVLDTYFGGFGQCCGYYVRTGDQHLLATIHRMSILCVDEDGHRMVPTPGSRCEAWKDMNENDFRFCLLDLCVEVHGYEIASSERELRMLLERVIQERGVRWCPVRKGEAAPKRVADVEYFYDDSGHCEGLYGVHPHLRTPELLDNMFVVTEIAQGKYTHHEIPYDENGFFFSVWDLMKLGLGPFA